MSNAERQSKTPKELLRTPEREELLPRVVITAGIAGVGKTTVIKELCRLIPNSFILDKDILNEAILHIPIIDTPRLPSIQEYVSSDNVSLDETHKHHTPFGEMFFIDPVNDYYARHAREQVYLAMSGLAKLNMDLGKVPILDCVTLRQIRNGFASRLIEQPLLSGYPKYLIYFFADEEDLYNRMLERAKNDPSAHIRDQQKLSSREVFHEFITRIQPILPPELSMYTCLLINTSLDSPHDAALKCLEYIKS